MKTAGRRKPSGSKSTPNCETRSGIGLCNRCEYRAKYIEENRGPRCECSMVGHAVCSCYMYSPVQPVLLRPNDGELRPLAGVSPLLAGRAHGVKGNPAYQACRTVEVVAADGRKALLRLPAYDLAVRYPRLAALGVKLSPGGHVPGGRMFVRALKKAGLDPKRFSKLYGIQTQSDEGMYAWDVEAVLERMQSGKKTGSQLLWD